MHDSGHEDLPIALAIIMDGNGRWAAERDLPVTEGHRAGSSSLKRVVRAAVDLNIESMVVYAFSTENWNRSDVEVEGIMDLLVETIAYEIPELHAEGVRISFMGRRDRLDQNLIQLMEQAEELTSANNRLWLVIAFNYGGQAEIVDAARRVAIESGANAIDEKSIERALYVPEVRHPDLIIRTGGEKRLSNFLTWQSAYSELIFVDVLWPDFTSQDLENSLAEFKSRQRRFGGRSADEVEAQAT